MQTDHSMKKSLSRLVTSSIVLLLAGCTNSLVDRSLIFSTHTTAGVEISVSPSETQSPVSLILGYKRFEGVINPVYHNLEGDSAAKSPAGRTVSDYYRPNAYSVMAKLSGAVTSNASVTSTPKSGAPTIGAGISGGQWFATGLAAEILAKQPGIAAAVSGTPVMSIQQNISSSLVQQPTPITTEYVDFLAKYLGVAAEKDATAAGILTKLNARADKIFDELQIEYQFGVSANSNNDVADSVAIRRPFTKPTKDQFSQLNDCIVQLDMSATALETILKSSAPKVTNNAAPAIDLAYDKTTIAAVASAYREKAAKGKKAILESDEMKAADTYVRDQVNRQ